MLARDSLAEPPLGWPYIPQTVLGEREAVKKKSPNGSGVSDCGFLPVAGLSGLKDTWDNVNMLLQNVLISLTWPESTRKERGLWCQEVFDRHAWIYNINNYTLLNIYFLLFLLVSIKYAPPPRKPVPHSRESHRAAYLARVGLFVAIFITMNIMVP